jgi:hypothetical protein
MRNASTLRVNRCDHCDYCDLKRYAGTQTMIDPPSTAKYWPVM